MGPYFSGISLMDWTMALAHHPQPAFQTHLMPGSRPPTQYIIKISLYGNPWWRLLWLQSTRLYSRTPIFKNKFTLAIKSWSFKTGCFLRLSLVTRSIALTCRTFCQEYIVFQTSFSWQWFLMAVVSLSLHRFHCTNMCIPPPRSIVVRASAWGAGGWGSIPNRVTPKT